MSRPGETARRPRRWLLTLACALLSTLAVVGHYFYWYAPRVRRAQPDNVSWVDRLWADERFSQAIWLPYPHQNLPRLAEVTGIDGSTLRRVANALGSSEGELPGFGPLALPPARALTVAVMGSRDYDGRPPGAQSPNDRPSAVLAAEVYPGFAVFARLAGRLANNPWLAGGRVTADGRDLLVVWHGRTWMVSSLDLVELEPRVAEHQQSPELPAALAALRWPWPAAADWLPEVRQAASNQPLIVDWQDEPATLWLRSTHASLAESDLPPHPDLEAAGAVLLALAGRGGLRSAGEEMGRIAAVETAVAAKGASAKGASAKGMAVFTVTPSLATELPWAATLFESEADRWPVPAEDILELTGREMQVASVGGLHIGAFQDDSFSGGRRLAPAAAEWLAASARPMKLAAWLQLAAGHEEMARISAGLESSPLIARSQRRQWRGAELLLAALARRFERAELLILDQPAAARFRLVARPGGAVREPGEERGTDN